MNNKPRFYCGLHQRYHHAIVKPCYFGIESALPLRERSSGE